MNRVLHSFAAGLLAATAGPAFGQVVLPGAAPLPASNVAPSPASMVPTPINPLAPATVGGRPYTASPYAPGFAGGFRTPYYAAGGYGLTGFGGGYFGPSYFPYASGFYPGFPYGYSGLYATPALNGGVPPATGLVGVNAGPTPIETPAAVIPLQPAGGADGRFSVELSGQQAATLTVALPAAGDVWLNGAKQKESGAEYTLTSPQLRAGESYKFDVRAEWLDGGKRYRADRAVSVAAGDRQKLTLVLGDLVK